MQSIELPAIHPPTANEKLLFDNKGSRFAKAVSHFVLFARFRFTFVSLTSQTPKTPNCPILEDFKYGGEGAYLKNRLDGCFKYAPTLVFVVKAKPARHAVLKRRLC